MRSRPSAVVAFLSTLVAVATVCPSAQADESIIKNPGDHPEYHFEAEPHGVLGFWGPWRNDARVGAGFRGTIVIVQNGFVPTINNSVGISFGGDFYFGNRANFFLPVAMQWNFWLSTHWSVFGEPGIGFSVDPGPGRDVVHPIFMAGGRYHFNDKVSLTMRLGYPGFSIGASFFL